MATTPRKKPGDFKADCRTTELRNVHDLDHEIVATARAAGTDLIHRRGEALIPMQCADEFNDRTRFLEHMASEHNKKPRGPAQIKLGRGGWRAPRASEEGRPFEPKDLEPGATVTWHELVGNGIFHQEWRFDSVAGADVPIEVEEREWTQRSGQVWSASWAPKSAWVIPFEPFEGETAVMVQAKYGRIEHHSTQLRQPQRVA